jgi:hypothetical protein
MSTGRNPASTATRKWRAGTESRSPKAGAEIGAAGRVVADEATVGAETGMGGSVAADDTTAGRDSVRTAVVTTVVIGNLSGVITQALDGRAKRIVWEAELRAEAAATTRRQAAGALTTLPTTLDHDDQCAMTADAAQHFHPPVSKSTRIQTRFTRVHRFLTMVDEASCDARNYIRSEGGFS